VEDYIVQPALQPFIKLAQANMELLAKFSLSPEVVSQSAAIARNFVQQTQEAAASLSQSNAFAQLTQGMLKNYTEFVADWNQSATAALAQGQAALIARTQEVAGNVVDAAEARGRRSRQAA
jgi:hypothetical protein